MAIQVQTRMGITRPPGPGMGAQTSQLFLVNLPTQMPCSGMLTLARMPTLARLAEMATVRP